MYVVMADNSESCVDALQRVYYCGTPALALAVARELREEEAVSPLVLPLAWNMAEQPPWPDAAPQDLAAYNGVIPGRDFPATL